MKQYYILFFSVAFMALYKSQIRLPKGQDLEAFENIIRQEKKFNQDTATLNQYLLPLGKSTVAEHKIIYNIMKANGYCLFYDNTNPQIYQYYKKAIKIANQQQNNPFIIWTNLSYASCLYKYRKYEPLAEPMITAMVNLNKTPEKEIIEPYKTYKLWDLYCTLWAIIMRR